MTSMLYQMMYDGFEMTFPAGSGPITAKKVDDAMAWFGPILPLAVRFEISNVAEYFYESTPPRKSWSWPRDIPNAAPVYDVMWFEHVVPAAWRVDHDRLGVLVVAHEAGDDDAMVVDLAAALNRVGRQFVKSEAKWILGIYPFAGVGRRIVGPITSSFVAVGADGTPLFSPAGDQAVWGIYPAGLALSFMHCKNVRVVETDPVVSRQVRRWRERAGIPPETKHKTLIIDPMKDILRREGGAEKAGLQRALHICRGHFSHYAEEKPLFGKYTGTFWIPAHVRGSEKVGVIAKDYRVVPGEGDHG